MKQKLLLTFALLLTAVTGAWADPTWLQPGDEWEEGSKTLTVKSNPVNDAYQGITEIENVNFAASVTSIGDRAFGYCTNLASVTIPDGVTSIGSNAFDGCSSLMSVDIPNSVTSIGSNAFSHTGLTSIDINVMMIGNGAFDGCTNLTTVNIGSKVSTIGNNPFAGCTKLSTINVASGNTKYDSRDNCNAIIDKNLNTLVVGCKGTTIPNSVTSIGSYAFLDSGLTSITLPASVTSIGMNAFYVCSSLASVTVYATTSPTLGDDAFYGCDDDLQIYVFSDYVGAYTTDPDWGVYSSKITAMTGGYCGTTGHESDVVWVLTGTTPNYTLTISGSGAMADYYGVNQPWYSNRTSISSIVIEDGVTRIGNNAFDGCNNVSLASVTLPASVTEIGRYAFNNCTNLATVTFASGSQLTSIGLYAFLNSGLTSITIPASVTSIGMQAFYGCSNLATVSGCEGVTNVGSNAFSNTEWLTNQPTGVIYIGKVAYYGKNVSGVVSINTGTVSISAEAFKNCTGLTAVSIPASVTSIGDGAFNYCTSLATVTFASGSQLTSIGGDAFSITGLTSITIPASVETIGDGAFSYCTNLANITVDENNTHFDSRDNCNAIIDKNLNKLVVGCKGTTIPNTVTSIGSSAFVGSGLTSITIPASVTNIGMNAFDGCNNLGTVTLNSNPYIGIGAFDNIKAGATVTMNLTANSADEKYWMTFYNENYNFQADANTQVFKAALSDTKVSLTELTTDKIVNKDNAVLLKSTASPIVMTLTSTNSENVFTGNDLNGVSDPAGKTDDGKMYVLNYTAANGVGFYKLATGRKLGVGKAYLSYSGGGASNFFGLDDDGTTNIDVRSKMSEVRGDGLYYDLNGRRVMNPTKGIYIVNGKKVLLK